MEVILTGGPRGRFFAFGSRPTETTPNDTMFHNIDTVFCSSAIYRPICFLLLGGGLPFIPRVSLKPRRFVLRSRPRTWWSCPCPWATKASPRPSRAPLGGEAARSSGVLRASFFFGGVEVVGFNFVVGCGFFRLLGI